MEVDPSGDSTDSSDNEEYELEQKASALEREIVDNKYLYDVHLQLIELYERLSDLKSLDLAYQRFSEYFPLTPHIWLSWIRKQISLATTDAEKARVVTLFDRAVEDYLSPELWMEYVLFLIGLGDSDATRNVINRALGAAGMHTAEGSRVWNTLRELELAHLSPLEPMSEPWKLQLGRVADVYKRQLSVPLLGMEETYEELKLSVQELPEGHGIDFKAFEWPYQQALKVLEVYKPFESQLANAVSDEEALNVYKEYVKAIKDPTHALCVYERAVVQFSVNPALWIDYCLYAMKLGDTCLAVSKRALRNCPWSEGLWTTRMRILEHHKGDKSEIMACFEQGLASVSPSPGLDLWLTYLEYVKRGSDDAEGLLKLFEQATELLDETGDPTSTVPRWHAVVLAQKGDMAGARRVWSQILHKPHNKVSTSLWMDYIALERQYGGVSQQRQVYQRALAARTDCPQYVADEWLMFERRCGTLQEVLKCMGKCQEVVEKKSPQVIGTNPVAFVEDSTDGKRKRKNEANGCEEGRAKKARESGKSDAAKQQFKPKMNLSNIDHDKSVFLSNMAPTTNESRLRQVFPNATAIHIVTDNKGKSRCFGFVQFGTPEEIATALARDREPIDGRPLYVSECRGTTVGTTGTDSKAASFKYSTNIEGKKLFVRGLPKSWTQKEVEGLFKEHGAVAVRIVTQRSGLPKGLAYVEFEDEKSAQLAMRATDQKAIGEHVITVAISAPPPKKAPFDSLQVEPSRHARVRLQVPLVPRVVLDKKTNATDHQPAASKSNEEFRKMFLS